MEGLLIKNSESKKHTDFYRPYFALNRNSAGLTPKNKEFIYTLVSDYSDGAYIYDIDGNEYIDLTMGFGSILLGHRNKAIQTAVEDQLKKNLSVGPISPLAGILAKEICEVTNNERTAFFNSGTEAVMVALRLAKAATGKKYIVYFNGAYHGTFDPLLSIKSGREDNIAQTMVPGITQSILNESYLLKYGSSESIEFIVKHKEDIAAILVEPVQSRRPDFVPIEYLRELREITKQFNIALIFDEIITGFRMQLGGCQEIFGITADIVTYGKVIGGGLPIGVVSGKAKFLDYTDGGVWQYNDESLPKSKMTFVAGTFCHHPLAMRSALCILNILKNDKHEFYSSLNARTDDFCHRMNNYFKENKYPLKLINYGSLFRFKTPGKTSQIYYHLLKNGVYVWEGRNCFFSSEHNDEVIKLLEDRIKKSCEDFFNEPLVDSTL